MPRLVFVAACHSQAAGDAFVEAGVPHVVAVRLESKILDNDAILFSKIFYTQILAGESVRLAFNFADSTVRANRPSQPRSVSDYGGRRLDCGSQFMLLPQNAEHSHDEVIFPQNKVAKSFVNETQPLPHNHCYNPPQPFVARHLELYHIFRNFVEGQRCVTIIGRRGIGKTVLAQRVAVHLQKRRVFCSILSLELRPEKNESLQIIRSRVKSCRSGDELVARALTKVIEEAWGSSKHGTRRSETSLHENLVAGSVAAVKEEPMWMRSKPPRSEDIVALLENLLEWISLSHTAMMSSDQTHQSGESYKMVDDNARNLHEEWRTHQKRPAWRKMLGNEEFHEWTSSLPAGIQERMYRYATQLSGVEAPDKDITLPMNEEKESDRNIKDDLDGMDTPYHWVDINQPFEYLPESWKEKNRKYVLAGQGDSKRKGATLCKSSATSLQVSSLPVQNVLIVLDGADNYRTEIVKLVNDLFKMCNFVSILSTCRIPLTSVTSISGIQRIGAASAVSNFQLNKPELLVCAEKLVKVEGLSHVEAAELLVHSAPRTLMLNEMGITQNGRGCTFNDAIHSLSKQPALQVLAGHPSAIRHFAAYLGAATSEPAAAANHPTWCKLDQLVDMAQMCRGEYDPGMAQALLKAKVKLGDDEGSARLWARLTFNPINEEQPLVSVPWEGTRGLINALEAELDGLTRTALEIKGDGLVERQGEVSYRLLMSGSDKSFLHSIVRKSGRRRVSGGESKTPENDVISYDEYVDNVDLLLAEYTLRLCQIPATYRFRICMLRFEFLCCLNYSLILNGFPTRFVEFIEWWMPTRRVIESLGADWRCRSPPLIHGFLDRTTSARLLEGHEIGTFLVRFGKYIEKSYLFRFLHFALTPHLSQGATLESWCSHL